MVHESAQAGEGHAERLADLLDGYIVTQIISTAVRLSIFDEIHQGRDKIPELALRTDVEPQRLRRLMRALEGLGLLCDAGSGAYRNTAMADLLRRVGGMIHGYALLSGSPYYRLWSHLEDALRSGRPGSEQAFGHGLWQQLNADPGLAEAFARTMGWTAAWALDEIMPLCDISADGVIADIGAGDGTLLIEILRRHPAARGAAFEQPAMIPHTRAKIQEAGLLDRCLVAGGDFFENIPITADLYVLQSVLHNWDDDNAVRLLANCRLAMPDGARLLVVDQAIEGNDLIRSAIRDLTMLVLFGSEDRMLEDYCALLRKAGLSVLRHTRSDNGICVIEAGA